MKENKIILIEMDELLGDEGEKKLYTFFSSGSDNFIWIFIYFIYTKI